MRFKVLDPVMGDSGVFYVPPSEAPVYQSLLPLCHLLLPNQFELETLTNTKIVDITSLVDAVGVLHREYKVPHVFVTSTMVKEEKKGNEPQEPSYLTLIGSTAKADGTPRAFIIKAPYFPVYFVGTGDTFAALITARLREEASRAGLLNVDGWVSPDGVSNLDLPLAKAAETVVASMQALLSRTHKRYEKVKATVNENNSEEEYRKETRLKLMKAAELKVVGHVNDLTNPPGVEQYRARSIDLGNFK
jgi:pyridoxine kinase